MELGVASSLKVKQFGGELIDKQLNDWLKENEGATVIDIKFSASAMVDSWGTDALVIYRV